MKKAQLSVGVAVALIVIVLVLASIALFFILTKPSLIGYAEREKYDVRDLRDMMDYRINEVQCSSPYIKVGNACCVDTNYNHICDSDEKVDSSNTYNSCGYPLVSVGGVCCRDENKNGRCDYDDDRYDAPNYNDRDREIDEDATLGSPFSVYDFDISNDEITLWIKNRGDETITIERVEIEDCDDIDDEVTLEENEKERFDFDCDKDNLFDRTIRVTYTEEGSDSEKTARGYIQRDYRYNY